MMSYTRKGLIMFLLIFGLLPSVCFCEKIDLKKVNEFIKVMEEFVKKNPDPFDYAESGVFKELLAIYERYELNDAEFLAMQDILTKDEDILEITQAWVEGKGDIPFNQDIWNKRIIFDLRESYQMEKWEKSLGTLENILMEKILPIINSSKNMVVVKSWLIESESMFLNINNKKLPLSDENRYKFCGKLIEIFRDENKPDNLRANAIESWAVIERRSEEIIKNVDYIIENKVLFKKTANILFRGSRTPKEVMEKMFNMLENTDKYSQEIVDGVLIFWGGASSSYDEARLKTILRNKIPNEKNESNKKRYEGILKTIKWNEEYREKQGMQNDVKE